MSAKPQTYRIFILRSRKNGVVTLLDLPERETLADVADRYPGDEVTHVERLVHVQELSRLSPQPEL